MANRDPHSSSLDFGLFRKRGRGRQVGSDSRQCEEGLQRKLREAVEDVNKLLKFSHLLAKENDKLKKILKATKLEFDEDCELLSHTHKFPVLLSNTGSTGSTRAAVCIRKLASLTFDTPESDQTTRFAPKAKRNSMPGQYEGSSVLHNGVRRMNGDMASSSTLVNPNNDDWDGDKEDVTRPRLYSAPGPQTTSSDDTWVREWPQSLPRGCLHEHLVVVQERNKLRQRVMELEEQLKTTSTEMSVSVSVTARRIKSLNTFTPSLA